MAKVGLKRLKRIRYLSADPEVLLDLLDDIDAYRKALVTAREAIRYNLAIYARKDEIKLFEAFKVCDRVLNKRSR